MGQSRSLVVLLIVVLAIVGYLWLSSLAPPAVSTTPTVPPASAPAPAAP